MISLAYLYWDPNRVMFTVPYFNRPVMWYGFFFVLGFVIGYFIILSVFKRKLATTNILLKRDVSNWSQLLHQLRHAEKHNIGEQSEIVSRFDASVKKAIQNQSIPNQLKLEILKQFNKLQLDREKLRSLFPKCFYTLRELSVYLADKLMWFLLGGTIIGARLGHVFFYEWPRFSAHPIDILKVWEGGLASHGGTLGIIIALVGYYKMMEKSFPELTFVSLMDIIAVPTGLAAYFIRIGNFANQEIIGVPTNIPFAIIFGHPADGSYPVPRHPAQLYEAIAYLATFFFLYALWYKKAEKLREGVISGLFFICIFGSRFLVEFIKQPLSSMIDESFLQTGQYLSIPFILLGVYLFFYSRLSTKTAIQPPTQQEILQDR